MERETMKRKKQRDQLELVLLYHLGEDTTKGKKLIQILTQMKIASKQISEEMLGETVGFLANLGGFEKSLQPYTGVIFEDECMIMRGFSSTRMDKLLMQMRNESLTIDLKASVTPYNRDWTLARLIQELQHEHQKITAQ